MKRLLGNALDQWYTAVRETPAAQGSGAGGSTLAIEITLLGETEHRTFEQSMVSIGRDYNNDIVLADKRVSRNHAMIQWDTSGVCIKDLGSSNGLRIGTQVIRDRQEPIQPGTQIWFTPGQDAGLTVNWESSLPSHAEAPPELGTLEKALKLFEVKFFKKLKTAQLVLLAQEAKVQTYQKGKVLYDQGAVADELMVVTEGTADAFVQAGDIQQWVGKIAQGETIGELSVLTQSTRSTTVIAAEAMQVLVIQASHFEALLKHDAPMVRQFLGMMSDRLQNTLTQLSGPKLPHR
jgi:Cyclic nucleotide-binding domain/FHA domain